MNQTCDKCSTFGLSFHATFISPVDYIEGKKNAEIWIIGLNPKGDNGEIEQRTTEQFEDFNPDSHSYFSDFGKVSIRLYDNFKNKKGNVAHTDLVKCFSQSFPPVINNNGVQSILDTAPIIENCKQHLLSQIRLHKPKVIICNGSPVCWEILKLFPPSTGEDRHSITSYLYDKDGLRFNIVLSGFIGRIDDRNKRRLGKEIEQIIEKENIVL